MDNSPFFIVGVPRSGTTMLAVMLNQHSRVFVGANAYGHQLATLLPSIRDTMTPNQCFKKFDFETQLAIAIQKNPRLKLILETDNNSLLRDRVRNFLDQLAHVEGKQIFGDKCPPVIDFVDNLRTVIPNARFIHVVRDGRSVALSQNKRQNTHALLAIHRWKKSMLHGELWQQVLDNKEFLTVQFEKIIQNPKRELQSVCDFLGLGYEDSMQDLSTSPSAKSRNTYVIPKIDSAKINTWENASPRLIRRMELVAGDVLERYGYDLKTNFNPSRISALSRFQEGRLKLLDAIKILGQREVVVMREQKLVPENRNFYARTREALRLSSAILLPKCFRDFLLRKSRLF